MADPENGLGVAGRGENEKDGSEKVAGNFHRARGRIIGAKGR
jgi:hypothetical protein